MKILHKIILIFTLTIFCPLLVTTILVRNTMENQYQENIRGHLKLTSDFAKNNLKSLQTDLLFNSNRIIEDSRFRNYLNMEDKTSLNSFLAIKKEVLNATIIQIIDEKNEIITELKDKNMSLILPEQLLDNTRELIQSSDIKMINNQLHAIVLIPVTSYKQPVKIFLVAAPLREGLFDELFELTRIHISLIQDTKRVLTTFINFDGKRMGETDVSNELFSSKGSIKTTLIKNSNRFYTRENILKEPYTSLYECLNIRDNPNPLYIGISLSKKNITDSGNKLIYHLYTITFLTFLFAVIAGYVLSRNIVRPLNRLVNGTEEIAHNNLETRIEITNKDEIGVLAESFNDMAEKLKLNRNQLDRKIFEISTMYDVTRSINFNSDSQAVLMMILDKSISALSGSWGGIFLYSNDCLKMTYLRGIKEKGFINHTLKSSEGICGKALISKEAIIVNDGKNHPDYKDFPLNHPSHAQLKNMVCTPIMTKDVSLGVICVANKIDGNIFNSDDVRLLNTLATQGAITLENAKLYQESITDGMTKLYLNRYFQLKLLEEVNRANRYSSTVSLLYFDIDHFKNFNDTYGHQTGDDVLIEMARIIQDTIRKDVDIPARYGGEEFAIIASQTNPEDALILAERLRQNVEDAELEGPNGEILKIKISIGIATCPLHTKDKDQLIKYADTALYRAKRTGRNKCVVFEESLLSDEIEE